jgi:hypothetical protein
MMHVKISENIVLTELALPELDRLEARSLMLTPGSMLPRAR